MDFRGWSEAPGGPPARECRQRRVSCLEARTCSGSGLPRGLHVPVAYVRIHRMTPLRRAAPDRPGPPRPKPEAADAPAPGERITVDVDALAAEGDGVARHGNLAVFIPQTAPGDRVEVEVTETAARFVRARVISVLRSGPGRRAAPCPVYADCGGCTWQHLDYLAQLQGKRSIVIEALRRLGHVAAPEALVAEPLPADPPWRYRYKMAVPFAPPCRPGDPLQAGFYAERSHRIVPLETCAIQHPLLDRALRETRRLAAALHVEAHDVRTRHGDVRHLVGRVSLSTGRLLLCLVTARADFPGGAELARGLMDALPECAGVVQNINGTPGNAILGRTTRTLAGSDHLVETLDGLRFLISAPSFFQVSPVQAAVLCRTAARQAGARRDEVGLDVYAGVGTLSLYLARTAGSVEAVEEVPEAVRDGRRNAAANRASHLRFHLGAAEEVVPRLVASGRRPAVVVLDPPRKGAAEVVLVAIARARPDRIVYVSCNPATLARDVERLGAAGYRLREVQPVDMFPQTAHVECSALLVRE